MDRGSRRKRQLALHDLRTLGHIVLQIELPVAVPLVKFGKPARPVPLRTGRGRGNKRLAGRLLAGHGRLARVLRAVPRRRGRLGALRGGVRLAGVGGVRVLLPGVRLLRRHRPPAGGLLEAAPEVVLMSVFDKHRDTLEQHETMMGAARGRLAVALDLLTDSLALVGQHGVYCRSERFPGKPKMDIALVLEQLDDAKQLMQSAMMELKNRPSSVPHG